MSRVAIIQFLRPLAISRCGSSSMGLRTVLPRKVELIDREEAQRLRDLNFRLASLPQLRQRGMSYSHIHGKHIVRALVR